MSGLIAGFLVWSYTLALPSLAEGQVGLRGFIEAGPWGVSWLHPYALFGISMPDTISHALFWSLLLNVGLYIGVSLFTRQSVLEHIQAIAFVDVYRRNASTRALQGTALVKDVEGLLNRFLGPEKAQEAVKSYMGSTPRRALEAEPEFIQHAETLLAGALGSASARVMIATVVKEQPFRLEEVMHILDETQQVIAYSQALEQKSRDLEQAKEALQDANTRLQELDRLKDDFVSTVTHELRTPLTSVRAFAEILFDNPVLPQVQRSEFLQIIIKESKRLTRLINQVLDFQKIESGALEWRAESVHIPELIHDVLQSMQQLFHEQSIHVHRDFTADVPMLTGDPDRLAQVLVNLFSNAAKFCKKEDGRIEVRLQVEREEATVPHIRIDVVDNGPGIPPEQLDVVFERFKQLDAPGGVRPQGSGLGLAISRRIVAHHGGMIWAANDPNAGAVFSIRLPAAP